MDEYARRNLLDIEGIGAKRSRCPNEYRQKEGRAGEN
jgi:hypothetical protein